MIDGEEYLTGGEAAKYLAEKWGIPSYSTTAFRMLRYHRRQTGHELKPDIELPVNASLWKKSTLDQIPKPDRSKPRGKRTKSDARPEAA